MEKTCLGFALLFIASIAPILGQNLPDRKFILKTMELANDTFMIKYADFTALTNVGGR